MFGLRAFFAALARLTASISRSADLFDAANATLEKQLGFDAPPALEHNEPVAENGSPRRQRAVKN